MIKGIKKIFSFAVLSFFTGQSFAQTVKEVQKEKPDSKSTSPKPDSAGKKHVSNIKWTPGKAADTKTSSYKVEGAGQKTSSDAKTAGKKDR